MSTTTIARPSGFVDPALGRAMAASDYDTEVQGKGPALASSDFDPEAEGMVVEDVMIVIHTAKVTTREVARLNPLLEVAGEPFEIVREDDLIYLRHERWSIVGVGRTLLDAENDLISEARDVAPLFLEMDPHEVISDPATRDLVEFLWRVL